MMRIPRTNPFEGIDSPITENYPLAPHTWYKIGGPARWFIQPRSLEDLQLASQRCLENNLPVHVLGLGANLLVSDEGVPGAVIRLDQDFFTQSTITKTQVEAGAGVDMQKLIIKTVRAGLAGLEVLAGIPGTIGGGVRMNAGGKFGDLGATVSRVRVMTADGEIYERSKDDLVFDYRSTNISAPFILGATLDLEEEDPDTLAKHMKEIWMYKRNSQPLNAKSAGCIFKNPRGLSAGALIDQAGLKGFSVGGAEVSSVHANFLVAHPGCRASDILHLIKIIKEKVYDKNQILLESEVKIWS
jgi:UDP-N-acetylmuramate dehydrogenase